MAPKKGKKMDLGAFLADEATGGSWADEMDALPTGPSGDPSLGGAGGLGGSHLSRGMAGGYGRDRDDYGDRPQRAEVPFPTAPPFTAFVGNLTFETVDEDLKDFFAGSEVTSVRIVSGPDGKPKGFGYVEFKQGDDLRNALGLSGSDLNGRTVRISVAEAPKDGRPEGRADAESTWTRTGPLAPLGGGAGRSGGFGGGSRFGGPGGAEVMPDVEREGPIRGGKFQASAPSESGGARRGGGFGGGFQDRNVSGGAPGGFERREFQAAPPVDVEREGPIRGGKFVPTPDRGSFGDRRASGPSRGDEERTWTRGAALPPAPQRSGSGNFGGRGLGDRTPPTDSEQRPRLQLAARGSTEVSPSASPAPSSRPSPFGNAKPVDAREREKEIEAKLAKDREALAAKINKPASSSSSSSPFGGAKPVDVSAKEKEVEDRIAKARMEAKSTTNKSASSPTPDLPSETPTTTMEEGKSAAPALRKEGFSYSSAANATAEDKEVDEVVDKVGEVAI